VLLGRAWGHRLGLRYYGTGDRRIEEWIQVGKDMTALTEHCHDLHRRAYCSRVKEAAESLDRGIRDSRDTARNYHELMVAFHLLGRREEALGVYELMKERRVERDFDTARVLLRVITAPLKRLRLRQYSEAADPVPNFDDPYGEDDPPPFPPPPRGDTWPEWPRVCYCKAPAVSMMP